MNKMNFNTYGLPPPTNYQKTSQNESPKSAVHIYFSDDSSPSDLHPLPFYNEV